MGRPKLYDLPKNVTFDRTRERYIVRNPNTRKTTKFPTEARARHFARKLNELLENERQTRALATGQPLIEGLVTKWIEDRLQFQLWAKGTRTNMLAKMNRIKRELGKRAIAQTDCLYLDEWITKFVTTAGTYNAWRRVFVLLWDFAVFRKLASENAGAKLIERSTSKKIEANRKQRQPLDLSGFKLIHEQAEPWLQLALEYSLVTLLARQEFCNLQHSNHRDGFLYGSAKRSAATLTWRSSVSR